MITERDSQFGRIEIRKLVSREPVVVRMEVIPDGLSLTLMDDADFYVADYRFRLLRRFAATHNQVLDGLRRAYAIEAELLDDELRARAQLFRDLYEPLLPEPDIKRDDMVQVIGSESKFAGRIGKVESVYWTNSMPTPRWLVVVRFRRGTCPIQPRNFNATELEKLKD